MKQNNTGPVIFGEVLFDCFPDGTEVLGGAPFNVAWNLHAFGLSPIFISRIGNDRRGLEVKEAMRRWGMDTGQIQIDNQRPTGTVRVLLDGHEPTFEISPQDAYGHIEKVKSGSFEKCPLLYHGSLALWNPQAVEVIESIKQQNRIPLFIDVNLRSPWWKRDRVLSLLNGASWVKLNEDELNLLVPINESLEEKAGIMLKEFQLKNVIVTRGKKGATIFLANGEQISIIPEPGISIVDTVGAGDAFSSVFILGIISKWPMNKTITHAQEFASAVVGRRGATVSDKAFYDRFIKRWTSNK